MSRDASNRIILAAFTIILSLLPLSLRLPQSAASGITIPEIILGLALVLAYAIVPKKKRPIISVSIEIIVCVSLALILASVLGTEQPINLHQLIRLLLIVWSVPIIKYLIQTHNASTITWLIILVVTLHAIWGIGQFILQHDFSLQYIGETDIAATKSGVAKFIVNGTKIIRAYGPYAHPNILGGILALGFIATLVEIEKKSFTPKHSLALGLLLIGLLSTFSRTALLAAGIFSAYWFGKRQLSQTKRRITLLLLSVMLVWMPLMIARTTDPEDYAYPDRKTGMLRSLEIIEKNKLWQGTGIGQYPTALKKYLEAENQRYEVWEIDNVHSVPLLIVSEWGLILSAFVALNIGLFILRTRTRNEQQKRTGAVVMLAITPLFLFDHYFLSQSMPAIMLALVYNAITYDERDGSQSVSVIR